ncbi:MAG: aryl-sulfate sulfotransferase [Pirellulales bacterium]|nr:aryl-sulfate sulfotransferase [Pirellulales bacterium]
MIHDPSAFQGYTLIASMGSMDTYLIDMDGRVVKTWHSEYPLPASVYLLENGHLLRTGMSRVGPPAPSGGPPGRDGQRTGRVGRAPGRDVGPAERDNHSTTSERRFPMPGWGPGGPVGGGVGGKVQEFTWDGELVWDFEYASDTHILHHDIQRLPNGNVLMIAWEKKTAEEAIAAGRNPQLQGNRDLQPDFIIEVQPTGKTTGEIVWEWHIWDHLIQDHDASKANYGDVAVHPELVDVNFTEGWVGQLSEKEAEKLRSLGYLGPAPPGGGGPGGPDWTHTNSIAYNAQLDQIVLSVHAFHEIWVIDHSTTTAEAAGHTGGRRGKGGDLLYRWGNPRAYRAGTHRDQQLFAQHDAHWIPQGLPGAGNLLVFNNGRGRPDGDYSSVDKITPPVDPQGRYACKPGEAYGPEKPVWSYTASKKADFFASLISGAQRLPNGNTIICAGDRGMIFEVTPQKEVVWKYINPIGAGMGPGGFGFPMPGPGPAPSPDRNGPMPAEILPWFLRGMIGVTQEQNRPLDQLQKEIHEKLDTILTAKQKDQRKDMVPGFGPKGFGSFPQPGQLMTAFLQSRLHLTDRQKQQMELLQKEVDTRLAGILSDKQRDQLDAMRQGFGPGGFPGPPGLGQPDPSVGRIPADRGNQGPFGPGNPGNPFGPGGFPPGGFGGPGGGPGLFSPPGPGIWGAQLFRAYRYAPDYPGLAGKELIPGKTIEELQAAEAKTRHPGD